MPLMSFDELMTKDLNDAFLTDFSVDCIYKSSDGLTVKNIKVQFFEESLDKLESVYNHAWAKFSDISTINTNDILIINGIEYGVVDFSPDEFSDGVNIFLQKV